MRKTQRIIPITCTSSHLVEVEELHPIQGNLKERTREQLQKLKSSILKYGFSFPIYVWESEDKLFTLDGHGRDFISKQLVKDGYYFKQKNGKINKKLPAVYIDAKDKAEAKMKLLAINSSYGKITEEGLLEFLNEEDATLSLEELSIDFDLPNIDFEQLPFDDLLGDDELEEEETKPFLNIFSKEQLKEEIKKNFPNFKTTQEIINGIIDIPLAMHEFNRLCSGKQNVGSNISLLFNPHRFETKVAGQKLSVSEAFITKYRGLLSSLSQWLSKHNEIVPQKDYIKEAKVGTGVQIVHEFRPALARDIYLDYCKKGTKVLDPCAGWGGRMIGFYSTLLGGEYFATDPSTKTFEGLNKLNVFLSSANFEEPPKITLENKPFEDLELQAGYYDFAFTSPPYFDTELYSNEETQAHVRYSTLEDFNQKFLTELIKKTMQALKPEGKFLLNIGGSKYRFDDVVIDICDELGLAVREVFKYKIGRGKAIVGKYKGNKLDNTIKESDLFFEIMRK